MVNLKRTITVLLSSIALVLGIGLAGAVPAQATGQYHITTYSYHYDWRCNQVGIVYAGQPYRPHTLSKVWYRTTRQTHSTIDKYWHGLADHVWTQFSHVEATWFYC